MWLVAGLGNPGKAYAGTRHNVGFDVVDELARRAGGSFRRSWRFPAEWVEVCEGTGRALLCKPRTFMNRSGQAIAPMLRKKGFALADLIVVVDDTELPCGRIRIRRQGRSGGHNGLKSIIAALGTDEFARIRIGVGGKPGDQAMVDHVLSGFSPEDKRTVRGAIELAANAVWDIEKEGFEKAMNRYNG